MKSTTRVKVSSAERKSMVLDNGVKQLLAEDTKVGEFLTASTRSPEIQTELAELILSNFPTPDLYVEKKNVILDGLRQRLGDCNGSADAKIQRWFAAIGTNAYGKDCFGESLAATATVKIKSPKDLSEMALDVQNKVHNTRKRKVVEDPGLTDRTESVKAVNPVKRLLSSARPLRNPSASGGSKPLRNQSNHKHETSWDVSGTEDVNLADSDDDNLSVKNSVEKKPVSTLFLKSLINPGSGEQMKMATTIKEEVIAGVLIKETILTDNPGTESVTSEESRESASVNDPLNCVQDTSDCNGKNELNCDANGSNATENKASAEADILYVDDCNRPVVQLQPLENLLLQPYHQFVDNVASLLGDYSMTTKTAANDLVCDILIALHGRRSVVQRIQTIRAASQTNGAAESDNTDMQFAL
jgi:hypothetical protein